jgi:hypothetical protein
MKAAVLLLLVLGCSRRAALQPATEQPEAARCTNARDVSDAQGAPKRNEARYEAALVAKHLTPITLAMHSRIGPGDAPQPSRPPGVPSNSYPFGPGGKWVQLVEMGQHVPNCLGGPFPQFAQDGSKIYRIVRAPRVIKQSTVIVCTECTPGPQFLCGGAQMLPETYGFALPEGTTYEGPISIEYDEEVVTFEILGKKPCPEEPRPP